MSTIHHLPREILDIILTELASLSQPRDLLRYSLVTKSWSSFLLCRLYDSVTLTSENEIKAFTECRMKDRYTITSLSIKPSDFPAVFELEGQSVLQLLDSLHEQPLKRLELSGNENLPLELWGYHVLAGLEHLVMGSGYVDRVSGNPAGQEIVKMRLKRLSFSRYGLWKVFGELADCLDAIITSSINPTPTLRHLDLGQMGFAFYESQEALRLALDRFHPLLPFLTTLSLSLSFSTGMSWTQPFHRLLTESTSLAHFSVTAKYSMAPSVLADRLRSCLESIPTALKSLTLQLTYYIEEHPLMRPLLRNDPFVTVEEFLERPVLHAMRSFSIGGLRDFRLEGTEVGQIFLQKMKVKGVRVHTYRD